MTPDALLQGISNQYIQIRPIRSAMRISHEDIAEATGISVERLMEIEAGEEASVADLRDIAFHLGTGTKSLLGESCFDTQVARVNYVLRCFADTAAGDLSGFWGHVGILPVNTDKYLWFPITETTRRKICSTMDQERMVIPCMNNRVLLVNTDNVKEIVLLDEACSAPGFANWDPSVSNGELPLVVYEALDDYDLCLDYENDTPDGEDNGIISPKLMSFLKALVKDKEWSDMDILEMIHGSTIYHKDGHETQVDVAFNGDESVSCEISGIYDFGGCGVVEKILFFRDISGAEILLNMNNVSLLDLPLLQVDEAISAATNEILDLS
jgi:hypothetical protein